METDKCLTDIDTTYFKFTILLNFVGCIILFYSLTYVVLHGLNKVKWNETSESKFKIVGYGISLLIGRVLALVVYFPAVTTYDTYKQFCHGLGYWPIDNQQPALLSLFYAFFAKVGNKLFGSMQYGVMLIAIF